MLDQLITKCENLMTFIPSNLYIHVREDHQTIPFEQLNTPNFLSTYMKESIYNLLEEKEKLPEEEFKSNQVYFYKDPFKMCYLTWPLIDESSHHYTITLGPLITDVLTSDEVRYVGYKMKLSTDNHFILESFYALVPFYDQIQIARISALFLDYLPLDSHMPQIIREDHSLAYDEEIPDIEQKFESFDFVEKNYEMEVYFLNLIEIGDVEGAKKLTSDLNKTIQLPTRFPNDPLRESKNMSITLNSISLRAALRGGLPPGIAHSLSHNFAIRIESQISEDSIALLNTEIMMTYTESVRTYALKEYSESIKKAITYIRRNIVKSIQLKDVANDLHLSKEHLSRQFKKEVGLGLSDYIHKTKIEESCQLINSNKYTVSDIAYTFGYSSPAHYTKNFKKFMGVPPNNYMQEKKNQQS